MSEFIINSPARYSMQNTHANADGTFNSEAQFLPNISTAFKNIKIPTVPAINSSNCIECSSAPSSETINISEYVALSPRTSSNILKSIDNITVQSVVIENNLQLSGK